MFEQGTIRFSKERNLDNLVRALHFLFVYKHVSELCSSNFTSLSILTSKSFTFYLLLF